MNLKEGSTLLSGKYRIIRILGQGGFGITYLAEHTVLGREVAIKEFFPKDFCNRDSSTSHLSIATLSNTALVEKLRSKFIKEARNISKLNHPGIIRIHDIFEENETAYYVMDYIKGQSLNEIVKRRGALPEAVAVEYMRSVGEALAYIHSCRMTHFDLKPANIMIDSGNNSPILIDFGLSRQYDAQGDATSTLMQGVSQGFSPIELYNMEGAATFSPQSDIYSWGASLYFILTGKVPPAASLLLDSSLQFPAGISAKTRAVIEKAMQVSRAKRPKSIESLLEELPEKAEAKASRNSSFFDAMSDSTASEYSEETKIIDNLTPGAREHFEREIKELTKRCEEAETKATLSSAKISENEKKHETQIEMLNDEIDELTSGKKQVRNIWIGILAVVLCIWGFTACHNLEVIDSLNSTVWANNYKLTARENIIKERENTIKKISNIQDVFIEDIDIKNDGAAYGERILAKNSTFLYPRIKAIILDKDAQLGVKIYAPYGLEKGKTSKDGYTYYNTAPLSYTTNGKRFDLSGWGNKNPGFWPRGDYRIEIWSKGKMIGEHKFKIY